MNTQAKKTDESNRYQHLLPALNQVHDAIHDVQTAGEVYRGAGQALAIMLVEGQNGTIDVSSQAGQGTTFVVRLHTTTEEVE